MSSKESEDTEGNKWKGPLPKGWTDESREKFWNTLTKGAPKHKVTKCIKKMTGKIDNPGAFCASLADRIIPGWREEAAKERKKKAKLVVLLKSASLVKKQRLSPLDQICQTFKLAAIQPLKLRKDYGEGADPSEKGSKLPGVDNLPIEEDPRVASQWISYKEMETLCPSCAIRMKKANIKKIKVSIVRDYFFG